MLAELRDILGDSATVRLVQAFGGREIRVPMRQQGCTWNALVEAIGHEAATRFCESFGGEVIYIAGSARFDRERRRALAAKMRAEGRPWREIARQLGYTERGTRKLLEKQSSASMPLFAEDVPA